MKGTHVVIAAAQSSSADWLNVPLPVKFKDSSNNSMKYDFKTDSFTINVPTVQIWGIYILIIKYSQEVMKFQL